MSKLKHVEFEPGWFAKTLHDAEVRYRVDHSRGELAHMDDDFPLSWEAADELMERMSERFESWTGRSLKDYIKARRRSPT